MPAVQLYIDSPLHLPWLIIVSKQFFFFAWHNIFRRYLFSQKLETIRCTYLYICPDLFWSVLSLSSLLDTGQFQRRTDLSMSCHWKHTLACIPLYRPFGMLYIEEEWGKELKKCSVTINSSRSYVLLLLIKIIYNNIIP